MTNQCKADDLLAHEFERRLHNRTAGAWRHDKTRAELVAIGAEADAKIAALAARVAELEADAGRFVDEYTPGDAFENAIRRVGVVAACEWFGHRSDSEFTASTMRILAERSDAAIRNRKGSK
jgi:hypothetical protein